MQGGRSYLTRELFTQQRKHRQRSSAGGRFGATRDLKLPSTHSPALSTSGDMLNNIVGTSSDKDGKVATPHTMVKRNYVTFSIASCTIDAKRTYGLSD
jgi:hypothetical protein